MIGKEGRNSKVFQTIKGKHSIYFSGSLRGINLFAPLSYHVALDNTFLLFQPLCLSYSTKSRNTCALGSPLKSTACIQILISGSALDPRRKDQRNRNMTRSMCYCRSKETFSGREEWQRILNVTKRLSNTRTGLMI